MRIYRCITLGALLAASMLSLTVSGQSTRKFTANKSNDYGLVYSLPTTVADFSVTARKTVSKAGPYCNYAEKYLGLTNVVMKDSQKWDLVRVSASTHGVANSEQQYQMQFKQGQQVDISCAEDGRLIGINVIKAEDVAVAKDVAEKSVKQADVSVEAALSTQSGDILASQSVSKRAELAAQQIYRIRQSRNDYMTGEADQMPDGEAMKIIMQRLDEQERSLMVLFTGTVEQAEATKVFSFTPDENEVKDHVLCRISDYSGIVDRTDLSGEPVYVSFALLESATMPVNEKGEEKKVGKDAIIYNIPGRVAATARYKGQSVLNYEFACAQVGIQFGLEPSLFTDKKQPMRATFSPATGAVEVLTTSSQGTEE